MGELATLENPTEIAVDRKEDLLSIIASATVNPNVDVEKMRALLEMKERIDQNDARRLFYESMIAAQDDMGPVTRNCKNSDSGSRFANLEAIDRAIRPIYTRHGFVLSFDTEPGEDGMITMVCDCMHRGGFMKPYRLKSALDDSGIKGTRNKTGVMAAGSTVSYLRRYLTCMIFNVVLTNEDNDGRGNIEPISGEQIEQLSRLLIANGINSSVVLEYMKVKAFSEIPANKFDGLMSALRKKIADKGKAK